MARAWMAAGHSCLWTRFGRPFAASDGDGNAMVAVRPLFSRETSAATNAVARRHETDVLWPLAIESRRGDHHYWRALLFYGTGVDDDPTSPKDPWRFRLFPFIFAGRTQDGENYGAVFPLGGTVRDFLFLHDFSFVLFPIYAEGRTGDLQMRTVLWPFYLTRHGSRVDQFRLWPLYGTAERRGRHDTRRDRFSAWPFWNETESYGSVSGGGFILFPLFGHTHYERERRGDEESWSLLPPLFLYGRGDDGYRKVNAPWPFVRILDMDDHHERHVWPLYGYSTRAHSSREYFLWPLVSQTEVFEKGYRNRLLHFPFPFYFHKERAWGDAVEGNRAETHPPADGAGNATAARSEPAEGESGEERPSQAKGGRNVYSRLWPLFSYRDVADDVRVRVPELSLWSGSQQVERNWAPLWSLYTYRRNPDGAVCNDFLWGLLSWGRNAEGGRILSLLWIPLAR